MILLETIQFVLGAHAPSRVPTGALAGRLASQQFIKWVASIIAASCSARARNTAREARALPIQLHRPGLVPTVMPASASTRAPFSSWRSSKVEVSLKLGVLAALLFVFCFAAGASEPKKIVFVAGKPSHGPAQHEHRAGCLLFKSCLDKVPGYSSVVYSNGWPSDPKAFDGASTIVIYADGGSGHPALQDDNLAKLGALMKKGVGLVCLHYATEPTIEKGQQEFLDWIGGAFEVNWSVNPTWDAHFNSLPRHPITRGVKPFTTHDEWYFHLRFPKNMKGVTPILSAVAPKSTMDRKDGPHEGNPAVRESVRKGENQVVAWAFERPGGGRGFGFTGGHYHNNWGNDDVRKLVLNAIVWTADGTVPRDGVKSAVSAEQLKANLDPKEK